MYHLPNACIESASLSKFGCAETVHRLGDTEGGRCICLRVHSKLSISVMGAVASMVVDDNILRGNASSSS